MFNILHGKSVLVKSFYENKEKIKGEIFCIFSA